jgi:hypothetical protein
MNFTDSELESVAKYVAHVKFALKKFPDEPVGNIFMCGCLGPLPVCKCMTMQNDVDKFLKVVHGSR